MRKNILLLSTGMIPWMGIKDAVRFARKNGYDGIEILPTRKVCNVNTLKNIPEMKYIFGIHQSWRLDMGHDSEYGISIFAIPFFTILRLIFFPKISISQQYLSILSKKINIPVTVHGLTPNWIRHKGAEFKGGVSLEILNINTQKEQVKKWVRNKNHSLVFDTRDDQSLSWAKQQGFRGWKDMWRWFGLDCVNNIQVTLIGKKGLSKILKNNSSLIEQQFLFLHKNKWRGSVTVEVNPLILFLETRGNIKSGLQTISTFIKTTLIKGSSWSTS